MLRSGNGIAVFSVLFVLLALFGLISCNLSNEPKLPKPPFGTPVNLAREGVLADFDIRSVKHNLYSFYLKFEFSEGDQADRERVRKIVGGPHEPASVPVPVKLTIFKKQAQDEQIYYRKTIEKWDIDRYGHDNYKGSLGGCNLPRGKYRFVLESLASSREYESIATSFRIGFYPRIKFDTSIGRNWRCVLELQSLPPKRIK